MPGKRRASQAFQVKLLQIRHILGWESGSFFILWNKLYKKNICISMSISFWYSMGTSFLKSMSISFWISMSTSLWKSMSTTFWKSMSRSFWKSMSRSLRNLSVCCFLLSCCILHTRLLTGRKRTSLSNGSKNDWFQERKS